MEDKRMNRPFALLASMVLVVSLTACAKEAPDITAESTPEPTPITTTPETEAPITTAPETTPEEDPTIVPDPPIFLDMEETVYATTTANVRESYSVDSQKVGSLNEGDSVVRTGIGVSEDSDGWSRVSLSDGTTAYIKSDYLSTTKPAPKPSTSTQSGRGGGSSQSSRGNGSTQSSGGGSSGGTQYNENGIPIIPGATMGDGKDHSGTTEEEREASIRNGTPGEKGQYDLFG